jgi:hypothetical protein
MAVAVRQLINEFDLTWLPRPKITARKIIVRKIIVRKIIVREISALGPAARRLGCRGFLWRSGQALR